MALLAALNRRFQSCALVQDVRGHCFQEPGARLRPWLRELSFWRHDTSTPVNKQGVKLYTAERTFFVHMPSGSFWCTAGKPPTEASRRNL